MLPRQNPKGVRVKQLIDKNLCAFLFEAALLFVEARALGMRRELNDKLEIDYHLNALHDKTFPYELYVLSSAFIMMLPISNMSSSGYFCSSIRR